MLIPVELDVDSEPMLLALVLMPEDSELAVVEVDVESEEIELAFVLIPLEAEVERDDTLLLVALRPVDSDVTPL